MTLFLKQAFLSFALHAPEIALGILIKPIFSLAFHI